MITTEQIDIWANAGVTGGVPDRQDIHSTLRPGDDIQAAIDAAHAAGGGVVLLQRGTYTVDAVISMKSDVVVRGVDREDVLIESTIDGRGNAATFFFVNVHNAGIENLTMDYVRADFDPDPAAFSNQPEGREDLIIDHVWIWRTSSNNWVVDTNILNAGNFPVRIGGDNNTFTGNYVSGAYNKGGGGRGYYNVSGDNNLIYNEYIEEVRHFGINTGAENNVIMASTFRSDVNYHNGDDGNNLLEGNVIAVAVENPFTPIGTGGQKYGHLPPGLGNVIYNNDVSHDGTRPYPDFDKDVVYTYDGNWDPTVVHTYPYPVATDWEVPQGGSFYNGPGPLTVYNDWSDNDEAIDLSYSLNGLTIEAEGGDDMVVGTGQADRIYGGSGDDVVDAGAGHDIIYDTLGDNTVDGADGIDLVIGGAGTLQAQGGRSNDVLIGGKGDDLLDGGSGNDTLRGDAQGSFFYGNDRLIAGTGTDLLEGGGGADIFVFTTGDGTNTIAQLDIRHQFSTGSDVVGVDFESGIDHVELLNFGYSNASDAFAHLANVDGQAQFSDQGTTIIFYGLEVADLSANDFLI